MKPAIVEGDRVVVEKSAYDFAIPFTKWKVFKTGDPERGEIVIFRGKGSSQLLIKRIIGLPGETIEIEKNKVRINKAQANYSPLQRDFFNHLDLYARTQHEFMLETFEDAEHSIMLQKKTSHASDSTQPIKIPTGNYYVLGDNRHSSIDSRNTGLVRRAQILGRAKAVAFSLEHDNFYIPRKDRFFKDLN